MKISFIKYEKELGYNLPQILGMNVEIVISNELASFSESIISKYKYDSSLNIVIMP